jgi:uncharacterized lipoprotein NlpE involved in copper resistance
MRTILTLAAIILIGMFGLSCKSSNPSTRNPDPAHTSENSLDWAGVYTGTLPCADCQGIQTIVHLFPSREYTLETRYLGKEGKPLREKGKFSWNDAGNIITLVSTEPAGKKSLYAVGENRITRLGNDGKPVTGAMASYYILVRDVTGLTDRYWKLTELDGQAVPSVGGPDREPYLTFDPMDKRVFGTGGCNNFFGNYELKEGNILHFSLSLIHI